MQNMFFSLETMPIESKNGYEVIKIKCKKI